MPKSLLSSESFICCGLYSTSKISSRPSRRTRIPSVPCVSSIWTVRSSRLRKENPVVPARRIVAEPMPSSARAPVSVQSLSPVVVGRLTTASTQSELPAGWKERDDIAWRASSWELRRMAFGGPSIESASSSAVQWRLHVPTVFPSW